MARYTNLYPTAMDILIVSFEMLYPLLEKSHSIGFGYINMCAFSLFTLL